MLFRYKFWCLIILLAFFQLASLASLNAAWWEGQSIPVPTNTEEVKKENRMVNGSEFVFIYYTSNQDVGSIKDFYRNRLPALGWKERDLTKSLGQVQGFKMEASFSNVLGQNLIFEKGSDMLIINFMPAGFSKDNKTHFAISQGKADLNKPPLPNANKVPELLAKPKKDVAPVYPGASLVSLSEGVNSSRATYFTKDDTEGVISFYKAKMSSYGWNLISEKPLERVEFGDTGEDISKHCPTCPKDATSLAKSMETWLAELKFSNQQGNACDVILSNVVTTQGSSVPINMTTILVNYDEKR